MRFVSRMNYGEDAIWLLQDKTVKFEVSVEIYLNNSGLDILRTAVNLQDDLLLFGLSVMLIILGKRTLALNTEAICFYCFLTVVWVFRACLATFIEPWPLEPVPAAAVGQLAASVLLAALMTFTSVCLVKAAKRRQ